VNKTLIAHTEKSIIGLNLGLKLTSKYIAAEHKSAGTTVRAAVADRELIRRATARKMHGIINIRIAYGRVLSRAK
jgi:hypothetical protein